MQDTSDNGISTFICPEGYWCEEGTFVKVLACPPGTYQPKKGAKERKECIPSPPGFFIADPHTAAFDDSKLCKLGFYCSIGSWKEDPNPSTDTGKPGDLIWPDYGGEC